MSIKRQLTRGYAVEGVPGGDTGAGSIVAGALEMSNVDLSEEFTEMIVAQRGFPSKYKNYHDI